MKIGYLGPSGSFTYTATKNAFPTGQLRPFKSIPACIKAVEAGEVDLCVVPVENAIEGSVNTTVDYLFHQAEIPVGAEISLPIAQQFMVHPDDVVDWQQVTRIMSHPQALAQCQEFLLHHFPDADLESTASTAFAANYVAEHPGEQLAAIAPKLSAETYHLEIVQENIQDLELNRTRFWVLGAEEIALPLPVENRKLTITVTMPNNIPGALHKVLSVFSWRAIDLSKVESRPLKTKLGEYFFLIDINVEQPLELIENALNEIRLMGGTVKVFGLYDTHPLHQI